MHLHLINVLILWTLMGDATSASAMRVPIASASLIAMSNRIPQDNIATRSRSVQSNYKIEETEPTSALPSPSPIMPQHSTDLLANVPRTARTTSMAFLPMTFPFTEAFNGYNEATNDNNSNNNNYADASHNTQFLEGEAIGGVASPTKYANVYGNENIDKQRMLSLLPTRQGKQQFGDYQQLQFHQIPGSGFMPTTLTDAGRHFATLAMRGATEDGGEVVTSSANFNDEANNVPAIRETNERVSAMTQIDGSNTKYISYNGNHQREIAFDEEATVTATNAALDPESAAASVFTPKGEIDYEINSANYDAAVDDNRLVHNSGARFVTTTKHNEQNANNVNTVTPMQHYYDFVLQQQPSRHHNHNKEQQRQQNEQFYKSADIEELTANVDDNGNEHVFQIHAGMHVTTPRVSTPDALNKHQQQHQRKQQQGQHSAFDQQYTDSNKHYLHDLHLGEYQRYTKPIKPRAFYYNYGSDDAQSNENGRNVRTTIQGANQSNQKQNASGQQRQRYQREDQESEHSTYQEQSHYRSEDIKETHGNSIDAYGHSLQSHHHPADYHTVSPSYTTSSNIHDSPSISHLSHTLSHASPHDLASNNPSLPPIITTVKHNPQSIAAIAGVPLRKHVEITKHIAVPHFHRQHVPYNQTVPIEIPKAVISAIPKPIPIKVPVTKTIAIPQLEIVKIPIEKVKPVKVERPVPYLVEKRVPYHVEHQVAKPVYYPYPIRVPLVTTVIHKLPAHSNHLHHHPRGLHHGVQHFSAQLRTKMGHLG